MCVGDRLKSVDGTDVLDMPFFDILQRLHRITATTESNQDQAEPGEGSTKEVVHQTKLFYLQFIQPANRQTVVFPASIEQIDAWFRPANACFYGSYCFKDIATESWPTDCIGAVYVSPVRVHPEAAVESTSAPVLQAVKKGSAIISINEESVCGHLFEDVLRLLRRSDYPLTVVFGDYVQGMA